MFKPGQSGNPGGRNPERERLRRLILEDFAEDAIKGIAKLASFARSEKVKLDAYTWLAEQAIGKAVQHVSGEDGGPIKLDVAALASKLRQVSGEE